MVVQKQRLVSRFIKTAAEEFTKIHDPSFTSKFDHYANARIVLIGDASHGTSEFYEARAAITQRLIEHHGFNIVAAEADWPDAHALDEFVRHQDTTTPNKITSTTALDAFQRFPRWMWRNREVQRFLEWLHRFNASKPKKDMVTICGLDLYSLGASIQAVLEYLDKVDPEQASEARKRYGCLLPWIHNPAQYGLVALKLGRAPCREEVVKVLQDMLKRRLEIMNRIMKNGSTSSDQVDQDDFLDAEMNAQLVHDSEAYYRSIYISDERSWNLRDNHMFKTLCRVLEARGPQSKVVVWAHNSHVGDARYTGMGMERGELNIGQLCREHFGVDNVAIIGCGTHTGTVAAAHEWDIDMEIMDVLPSIQGSYERLFYESGLPRCVLDLRQKSEARQALMETRLERFIGVIYRPQTERWSHYSDAVLPKQFDAYIWFKDTTAVRAMDRKEPHVFLGDETYPFGL
ncbi:hypothetical protein BGW41_005489 [Actinomortierella wolfii]|nr:hypothetical protein BGW41_005489 [Actinomortierella wolfii]